MADTISVRFDKDIQADLSKVEKKWKADRSEVIRRLLAEAIKKWKIDNFLEEVRSHKKSVGKTAEDCEVSIWEMLAILKEKNINWTGYSDKDIQRDLSILK